MQVLKFFNHGLTLSYTEEEHGVKISHSPFLSQMSMTLNR